MKQTPVRDLSNNLFLSHLPACPKIARIESAIRFAGALKLNEGYTLMTHKTYIALATSFALALGSLSPAFAEDAPMDDKAETTTEGTAAPAGDVPDKSAETSDDKG